MKIFPAATSLIIKDHPTDGIQVLLLKRNSTLKFAPDFWVFPGGRIDETDGPLESHQIETTAKIAAVRETLEEANVNLIPENLKHFCHWTTPLGGYRRFGTWFFHGHIGAASDHVTVDMSEIVDHIWIHPQDAINEQLKGNLPLLPPTFITLQRLKQLNNYKAVNAEFNRTGVIKAAPVTILDNNKFYCLYRGDSGYESGDIHSQNVKHRLIIDQNTGLYHFEYEKCEHFPPVNGGVKF